MIKFCPKCETAHEPSRSCDPKGLKAVSSRTRPMVEQVDISGLKPADESREGASPSGPTKFGDDVIAGMKEAISWSKGEAALPVSTYDADGKLISNEVRKHEPNTDCRGSTGRGVAASASDPVTVGITKRGDEPAARQGAVPHIAAELSQPPQVIHTVKFLTGGIEMDFIEAKPFDRTSYQRDYMRDLPKAKAVGMTVAEWRKANKDA